MARFRQGPVLRGLLVGMGQRRRHAHRALGRPPAARTGFPSSPPGAWRRSSEGMALAAGPQPGYARDCLLFSTSPYPRYSDSMPVHQRLGGVITPILTPFNDDLGLAPDLYLEHARWLLDQGIHYLSPFGTTGEALSMAHRERLDAVDALIDGGIDPARLMPGTGLCNLPETLELTRHAVERGCAAVMTLQPLF
ncbi:MAG: dihydrodipicolinate synthase family protein [Gammaproteobacteria bacterium]|nr:dihydrodipicolinate synthase family protein [Gammaproteobacteria bacterium]